MESTSDSLLSPDSSFSMNVNEVENLKFELQNETKNRNTARQFNKELEHNILEYEVRLANPADKHTTEWDDVIESQTKRNENLKVENIKLKEELARLKQELKNEKICGKAECTFKHEDLHPHLDCMNEAELIKTVKRLERAKTDIKSALLNKQWNLDTLAKPVEDRKIGRQTKQHQDLDEILPA